VILVCCQIEFLALLTRIALAFGTATLSFSCKCCSALSAYCHFFWKFLSGVDLARYLEKSSHSSCKRLGRGSKQRERVISVDTKLGERMPHREFKQEI
jgi:hypothetical protein